jgi:hypothetical protein
MKVTKFYKGTPEQAMSLAERISRDWAETKAKAEEFRGVKDAMENLLGEIDSLDSVLRYSSKTGLLDAVFMFSTIEEALDIVRIKVEQARESDEDLEEDDYEDA